ncbi:MAG: hypothetical protein FRX49_02254 [Trebouxia sp. A1-2]|nr:MAG: hypothetical protein FRX49_02254 [Trebouxia sp. A1-2]
MSTPYTLGYRTGGDALARSSDTQHGHTFLAPALRTMSTICDMVVPRTMLSSTSSTLLPEKTAGMAFSLRRTDSSLVRWSGMMKVRPTYLFLTRPSRYGRPSSADIWMAAGREPSGTGTTQSMSHPDFLKACHMTCALQQLHGGYPCLKHQLHLVVGGVTCHAFLTAPLVRSVNLVCQNIQEDLQQAWDSLKSSQYRKERTSESESVLRYLLKKLLLLFNKTFSSAVLLVHCLGIVKDILHKAIGFVLNELAVFEVCWLQGDSSAAETMPAANGIADAGKAKSLYVFFPRGCGSNATLHR